MNLDLAGILPIALKAAAIVQLVIAALNLRLVKLLRWQAEIDRLPLLMRQVFFVHLWFVSLTLAIFAVLTWRNAGAMATASNEVAQGLAGAIALFWGVRTVLQVAYYSSDHWRGERGPTVVHVTLLSIYGAMTVVYALSCTGVG